MSFTKAKCDKLATASLDEIQFTRESIFSFWKKQNPKKYHQARRTRIDWSSREDVIYNASGNRVLVGSPKIPWHLYSQGFSFVKQSHRSRFPRVSGTGRTSLRDKMTGKAKGRCSGGAFGKGPIS